MPDWEKDAVPEEVKRAAREMGLKAWKERLKEIRMSEYDAELYERYSKDVARQVQSLRTILDNLQVSLYLQCSLNLEYDCTRFV